jgi:flavin reductase (DIM6/NTAB) family NADH-FMN oxidoreductase RutF
LFLAVNFIFWEAAMQNKTDYEKAIKTKYPEQVVVAIARDDNGKANPVTLGWTMITSGSPPMMAIALAHKRYTAKAIRHSKCFTIAYPSKDMADEVMLFGTNSGRDMDKLEAAGSSYCSAEKIDSVLLEEATANFECVLENEIVTGDHIVFIGKVVASHINTETTERLYIIGPGGKLGAV